MAKKQLRTVKKSSETGRLSRADVRSAVISVRDGRTGPYGGRSTGTSGAGRKSGSTAGSARSKAA